MASSLKIEARLHHMLSPAILHEALVEVEDQLDIEGWSRVKGATRFTLARVVGGINEFKLIDGPVFFNGWASEDDDSSSEPPARAKAKAKARARAKAKAKAKARARANARPLRVVRR
jgi:hypothetical protein